MKCPICKEDKLKQIEDIVWCDNCGFSPGKSSRIKWIKTSDRLPEESDIYIVHFTYQQLGQTRHAVTKGVYKHLGENLFFVGGEPHYDITHWMPFPDPPEETDES